MATATVSAKGWIVIPVEYRRKYRLEPGTKVQVVDYGGVLALVPASENPERGARGILRAGERLTEALLSERRQERQREAAR